MKPVKLIAGPGCSGTTFLWELLKELGFDTGDVTEYFHHRKAEAKKGNIPYIVKGTAGLCHNFPEYVKRFNLQVDHVIVALRNLESNVKSKARTRKRRRGQAGQFKNRTTEDIRDELRERIPLCIGRLMLHLLEGEHPHTVIMFPRSAQDVDYCYEKITSAMGDIQYDEFVEAWNKVVQPELIRNEV
jgi:hypothetical protein